MRPLELFLKLLAEEVYNARVGGMPLNDASDFKAWLHLCSRLAAACHSEEEFFSTLRK